MSLFVIATAPPRMRTKNIQSIRLLFAGGLALLALLQLFTFEEFPSRLVAVGVMPEIAPLLATFLVTAEVLALPFVLRLRLSPVFRVISMGMGWIVSVKLLGLAILENISSPEALDGMFGATLPLPVGSWTICAALALCVLAAWTSWGMWPFHNKK